MVQLLRSGELDVDLETGAVTSYATDPAGRRRKTRVDHNGYEALPLYRCVSGRVKRSKRLYMTAFVHRLVMVKKIAVDAYGEDWRAHVRDLPPGVDVDHLDRDRLNNSADNLQLRLYLPHRRHEPFTAEEEEALADFLGYTPEPEVPF